MFQKAATKAKHPEKQVSAATTATIRKWRKIRIFTVSCWTWSLCAFRTTPKWSASAHPRESRVGRGSLGTTTKPTLTPASATSAVSHAFCVSLRVFKDAPCVKNVSSIFYALFCQSVRGRAKIKFSCYDGWCWYFFGGGVCLWIRRLLAPGESIGREELLNWVIGAGFLGVCGFGDFLHLLGWMFVGF